MKKTFAIANLILSSVFFAAGALYSESPSASGGRQAQFDVAAYVWPAYHPEPLWKDLGIFSHGVGEWQNVYEAVPKKPGHRQPLKPLWGYENEADPIVVARKIDAALAAGVNVFICDWYWYRGRPFLEGALNNGFLKAPNNGRMKFFLMWANHDVSALWDNRSKEKYEKIFWRAAVSYGEFTGKIVPRVVGDYFRKPNYYKIDGKPVFSVYKIKTLVEGMGSVENVKKAFEYLDEAARKAGFKGVHLMLICPLQPYTFGKNNGIPSKKNASPAEVAEYLGFESFTTYNWICENYALLDKAGGEMKYSKWVDENILMWDKNRDKLSSAKYFPHVSIDWDTNPRYLPSEYTHTVLDSNPADFSRALRAAKSWSLKNRRGKMPNLITVNAWNEWTEGCYLEPSEEFGYGFLNAVAENFCGGDN